MSLEALLRCPRGGMHTFRLGMCASWRLPESRWRKQLFARTTIVAPRREHG